MSDRRLVITDWNGDSATFVRNNNETHLKTRSDLVVVSGEDLWRLREFINALPEKAFVEPKAPWQPGDVISVYDSSDLFYIRGPEHWTAHGRNAEPGWRANDEEMDAILARQAISKIERRGGKRA